MPDSSKSEITDWQNQYLAKDLILATYTSKDTHTYGAKVVDETMSFCVLLRKKGEQWLAELVTLTPVVPMPGK